MAWCIVKKKEGPEKSFGQALENVDGRINLHKKIFGAEIPIAVLASSKENPSLPKRN